MPRSVQQSIPIDRIYADGVWQSENVFSLMWQISDINYAMQSDAAKQNILTQLGTVYAGIPADCWMQVCIVSQRMDEKAFAMLSMLEYINTAVMSNERNDPKAATWVYFDEIYLLLRDSLSANFLYTSWKRFRKYNAYATGITQNVQDCLTNDTAYTKKKLMGASWQRDMVTNKEDKRESLMKLVGQEFVIIDDFGWPRNPDGYNKLVKRVAQKAGISDIHPHMFRHTFVSLLMSNPDIGVATVAAEAGHAQPSTTLMIYTQQYKKRRESIRNQLSRELYEK